jgi:hypothetical protein
LEQDEGNDDETTSLLLRLLCSAQARAAAAPAVTTRQALNGSNNLLQNLFRPQAVLLAAVPTAPGMMLRRLPHFARWGGGQCGFCILG